MSLLTCSVYLAAFTAFVVFVQTTSAQNSDGPLAFEVASVRRSDPKSAARPNNCRGGPGTSDPGLLTCTNAALKTLVCLAYKLQFYEVVTPDWMSYGGGENGYDVAAKIPADTDQQQYRLMFQKMLTERFHLVAHRETRNLPTYVLLAGKGHHKLPSSVDPSSPSSAMTIVDGHIRFSMHGKPVTALTNFLTVPLGAPAVDETRLQGNYDLTLDFMPDERWVGFNSLRSTAKSSTAPSLFQAIQDQLGLKLEARKGPVSVLVIDSADKMPVEN